MGSEMCIRDSGKKIVVGSLFLTTGDTAYIDSTIIDGDASSSVATFISGEDSTAVLTGLTLINGYTTITGGGGIRIENSSPRLKNLKILNSVANVGGGGISCEACDSRITEVVIANNSVTGIGGGMRMFNGSNPELLGVTVTNNTSTLNGGGIAYEGLPASTIEQRLHRVTVSGNRSSEGVGGGIYLYSSIATVTRSFIQDNAASLKGGGLSIEWASELTLENSFVSGNALTNGVQGSNVYIGKSDQLIGSNEKLIAMCQTMDLDRIYIFLSDLTETLTPKQLEAIDSVRRRFPTSLIWTPGIGGPDNCALLSWMGVDLFDLSRSKEAVARGVILTEDGPREPESTAGEISDLQTQIDAWKRALGATRSAIREGTIRQLAERQALSSPRSVERLRRHDSMMSEKASVDAGSAGLESVVKEGTRLLCHSYTSRDDPLIQDWRRRVSQVHTPPNHQSKVLVLLPCSAQKPYRLSQSHRRFQRGIPCLLYTSDAADE